jgi:hypothetical protein
MPDNNFFLKSAFNFQLPFKVLKLRLKKHSNFPFMFRTKIEAAQNVFEFALFVF